jgi:hypothetical protein
MSVRTAPPVTRDRFLRLALRADAVLTGLAGLVSVPLAGWLAELSGTTRATEYGLAAFFIGYGVVVFGLSLLPTLNAAGPVVIAANLLYTAAAVVVVVAGVWPLTTFGVVVTLATGVYTLVFADLQYLGWRRLTA